MTDFGGKLDQLYVENVGKKVNVIIQESSCLKSSHRPDDYNEKLQVFSTPHIAL